MDVKSRIFAGTVLMAGVVLTGLFGMMIHKEELEEVSSYIAGVTYEKEDLGNNPKIALTFDDGPHPYYTEQTFGRTERAGSKGFLFCVGKAG